MCILFGFEFLAVVFSGAVPIIIGLVFPLILLGWIALTVKNIRSYINNRKMKEAIPAPLSKKQVIDMLNQHLDATAQLAFKGL